MTKKSLANAAKDDKVISVGTIDSEDTVSHKSEYSEASKEEIGDNDSDLSFQPKSEAKNQDRKAPKTARDRTKNHVEVINEEKPKPKDTFGDKLRRTFGFQKSVQPKEPKPLAKSFFGSSNKPKTKANQSLVDYTEASSTKKEDTKTPESLLKKPRSALKYVKYTVWSLNLH